MFIELVPQKVVDTKTVVLKARLDPRETLLQGEKLKRKLFRRLWFLEPESEEIRLVGFEKFYELYKIIGGEYSIDYLKKHVFTVRVGEQTREIFIAGKKYSLPPPKPDDPSTRVIQLTGEESAHYSKTTYYILDRFKRVVPPETIPIAPYEDETEPPKDINLRRGQIETSMDEDIEFVRTKIAKRPVDVAEIIKEVFEITERTIVHCPIFELIFQNIKTGKDVTLKINAVSGRMSLINSKKLHKTSSSVQSIQAFQQNLVTQPRITRKETKQQDMEESLNETKRLNEMVIADTVRSENAAYSEEKPICNFPAQVKGEVLTVGDNVTAIIGDMEIPSGTSVNELLVVKGNLKVGNKCHVLRKLKALGNITLGSEVVVEADMVAGRNIDIGANSIVRGSVKAKGKIHFHGKVTFERKSHERPDTEEKRFEPQFFVASGTEKNENVELCEK